MTTSAIYKELVHNEKKNFQLINAAVSDLGGVPAMIQYADMSNTIPDEKVMSICLKFVVTSFHCKDTKCLYISALL